LIRSRQRAIKTKRANAPEPREETKMTITLLRAPNPQALRSSAIHAPFNAATPQTIATIQTPTIKVTEDIIFKNGGTSLIQSGDKIFLRSSGFTLAKAQITQTMRPLIARLAAGVTASVTAAVLAELAVLLGWTAIVTGPLLAATAKTASNSEPDFQGIRRALTLAGCDLNKYPEQIKPLLSVDSTAFIATADRLVKAIKAGTKTKAQAQGILKRLYQKVTLKPLPINAENSGFGDVSKRKLAPFKKTNARKMTSQLPSVNNTNIGQQLGKVNNITPTHVAKGEDIADIALRNGIPVETLKTARQVRETYEQTAQRLKGSHREGETYDQTAERHANQIDDIVDKLKAILDNHHNTEQERQVAAQLIRQMDEALVVAALNRIPKEKRYNFPEVVRMAISNKFKEAFN
jgi:hypothetical protein